MAVTQVAPRWHKRIEEIPSEVGEIVLPDNDGDLAQDEEWCEVILADETRRIRFHDYGDIYEIPGLYERLFYEQLKCCSPSRTVSLLTDVLDDNGDTPAELSVLDLGAGNGMVADELKARQAETLVGVDIIPQAKMAAERDRADVYDDYFVMDFTDLPEGIESKLRARRFNCLITVAALGFGDIPAKAFIKALDLIETPGWVALTIKEEFLHERDTTGFSQLIRQLNREEIIQIQAYRRFRHRVSMAGKPLYYVALVARKTRDVPDKFFTD